MPQAINQQNTYNFMETTASAVYLMFFNFIGKYINAKALVEHLPPLPNTKKFILTNLSWLISVNSLQRATTTQIQFEKLLVQTVADLQSQF